ncbi:hypothetical protein GCM10010344_78550 [Streptomyces bluensis]|nr:hypothetical protein GCM10010344_78550 [Streptomyces bluensis]
MVCIAKTPNASTTTSSRCPRAPPARTYRLARIPGLRLWLFGLWLFGLWLFGIGASDGTQQAQVTPRRVCLRRVM